MLKYFIIFLWAISALSNALLPSPINPDKLIMPDSVKQITDINDLKPYLNNDYKLYKLWGIQRLGQVASPSEIHILFELYDKESNDSSLISIIDELSLKYHMLIAIAEVGGPEAEAKLYSIFDEIVSLKPHLPDSIQIIWGLCDALGKIGSIEARQRLESAYEDTTIGCDCRIHALLNIFRIEFKDGKYATIADTVEFLYDKISNNYSRDMKNYEDFIITDAVTGAIILMAYPAFIDAFNQKLATVTGNDELKTYIQSNLQKLTRKFEQPSK